ncbi:MAG: class II aldolase/adducin family protein [Bacteroidota bacterium]
MSSSSNTLPAPEAQARQTLVQHYQELFANGLCRGTSGNVSVRYGAGFLITPSGVPSETVSPENLVYLPLDCAPPFEQNPGPSSEWRFHRDILRHRPEVNAVVHIHAPHVTALAINRQAIPAVHYMIALFGGDSVRCAPYALFGTQDLSDNIMHALAARSACLLANHGAITTGKDLAKAVNLAYELELLAQQYILALQAGTPVHLSEQEITEALRAFKTYGSNQS